MSLTVERWALEVGRWTFDSSAPASSPATHRRLSRLSLSLPAFGILLAKRTLAVIAIVLAVHLLVGCSAAPKRYLTPPSTVPLRATLANTHSAIAQATAAAGQAKLALQQNKPEEAAAAIDELTVHLLSAQKSNEQAETHDVLELDTAITKQTTTANEYAGRAETAETKAKTTAKWRNRFLFAALGLGAWIFRKPLLALGGGLFKLARLACGFPV